MLLISNYCCNIDWFVTCFMNVCCCCFYCLFNKLLLFGMPLNAYCLVLMWMFMQISKANFKRGQYYYGCILILEFTTNGWKNVTTCLLLQHIVVLRYLCCPIRVLLLFLLPLLLVVCYCCFLFLFFLLFTYSK